MTARVPLRCHEYIRPVNPRGAAPSEPWRAATEEIPSKHKALSHYWARTQNWVCIQVRRGEGKRGEGERKGVERKRGKKEEEERERVEEMRSIAKHRRRRREIERGMLRRGGVEEMG